MSKEDAAYLAARKIMQCELEHQERVRKNRRREIWMWVILGIFALASIGWPVVLMLRGHR